MVLVWRGNERSSEKYCSSVRYAHLIVLYKFGFVFMEMLGSIVCFLCRTNRRRTRSMSQTLPSRSGSKEEDILESASLKLNQVILEVITKLSV